MAKVEKKRKSVGTPPRNQGKMRGKGVRIAVVKGVATEKTESVIEFPQGVIEAMKNSEKFVELKEKIGEAVMQAGGYLDHVGKGVATTLVLAEEGVYVERVIQDITSQSEELRKSVSKPLFDAKKQVDGLFKNVQDDLEEREKQVRSVLQTCANSLKSTTKFPGIGVLIVIPKNDIVVVDMEMVPNDFIKKVVDEAKVNEAVSMGLEIIPGLDIKPIYSIQVRGENDKYA